MCTCLELVYSCCKPQEALASASHRDFSQKPPFKVFLPIEYYHRAVCTPGTAKLFHLVVLIQIRLNTYFCWKLCDKFTVIVQQLRYFRTLLLTCLITSSVKSVQQVCFTQAKLNSQCLKTTSLQDMMQWTNMIKNVFVVVVAVERVRNKSMEIKTGPSWDSNPKLF